MKIVRKTERELVVVDSGLFLCVLFVVLALVLLVVGVQSGKHLTFFGTAFFLFAAGVCLRRTAFVFDRVRGIASWQKRKLFTVSSGEIPFGDISDIGLDAMPGQKGETTYRLTVITVAGRVPMSDMYGGGQKYYETVRDSIVEFLAGSGSPVRAAAAGKWDDESLLRAMIQQGRRLDAIALVRSKENLSLLQAKERVEEIDRQIRAER
jgi:hypothetical protein